MTVLTSDFECTIWDKGSAFDPRNKAICLGWKVDNNETVCYFEEPGEISSGYLTLYYDLCVFFNAKFDLHWYRRLGFELPKRVWCCQLAEFILSGQKQPYPSLEDTAVKYGLGHKIDAIKLNYWDKGINTDAIPIHELREYCVQDVDLTYAVYLKQLEQFQQEPALFQLFKLQCQDLLVLEEMEWNGLLFDENLCKEKQEELEKEIDDILKKLSSVYPDVPINFNSGDQLSAFLYGGTIYETTKQHIGYYGPKAAKAGEARYKNIIIEHQLPRLVEPLKKSELQKPGFFKTDEGTLQKLKGPAARKFVGPLLRLAELEKLNSTYYRGLVEKNREKNWKPGEIHGQFNQVVAATGRLSSSDPNLQNMAGECLDIFVSRYDN